MQVLRNATIVDMAADRAGYRLADRHSIAIEGARIAWTGADADLPAAWAAAPVRDLGGRLVTPGLIDCHTHIVSAGNRAGGGILADLERIWRNGLWARPAGLPTGNGRAGDRRRGAALAACRPVTGRPQTRICWPSGS